MYSSLPPTVRRLEPKTVNFLIGDKEGHRGYLYVFYRGLFYFKKTGKEYMLRTDDCYQLENHGLVVGKQDMKYNGIFWMDYYKNKSKDKTMKAWLKDLTLYSLNFTNRVWKLRHLYLDDLD